MLFKTESQPSLIVIIIKRSNLQIVMKNILLLFLVLFLASCQSDIEIVESMDSESGIKEVFERSRKSNLKEGYYRKIDSTGIMLEDAQYEMDQLNGTRKLFSAEGKLIIEETHKNGVFDGPYRTYHPDGTLELEGFYSNNETTGTWRRYYPNGQILEEVVFSGNMENGPFKEWYDNGKLKAEGSYLEGDNEHGELLEYDETGTLVTKKMCERGICKTIWTKESSDIK